MSQNQERQGKGATSKHVWGIAAAAGLGACVWIVMAKRSAGHDAWDDVEYFTWGLPLIGLGCLVLGYWAPHRAWRYGAVAMATQAAGLLLGGGFGNLWPVSVLLVMAIALPMMLAGLVGAWARRRR